MDIKELIKHDPINEPFRIDLSSYINKGNIFVFIYRHEYLIKIIEKVNKSFVIFIFDRDNWAETGDKNVSFILLSRIPPERVFEKIREVCDPKDEQRFPIDLTVAERRKIRKNSRMYL